MANSPERTAFTIARPVFFYFLFVSGCCCFAVSSNVLHLLSHGAYIVISGFIVIKFISRKRMFIPGCFMLKAIELVVFYIGLYLVIFQVLIVLFGTVTCICSDVF